MPEFLYLVSTAIKYKHLNNLSSIKVKYDINDPQNILGASILGYISNKEFYITVKKVISYIDYYNVGPNYISTKINYKGSDKVVKIQYQLIIFLFSKFISNDKIPNSLFLNISYSNPISNSIPIYNREGTKNHLNNKYNGESLAKYLKASKNCQSNSAYIKKLSKKITKGCKSKLQKAKAIFNWVRDNVVYTSYYNTKYGAKNALINRKGNCVDQSHALISLYRASKIPARYVHGYCKFVSGHWYGHVWTQVLVGKVWYVADASNYELNGFGHVNNWKYNSYSLYGKYSRLNF